jgi:hypothetical protein
MRIGRWLQSHRTLILSCALFALVAPVALVALPVAILFLVTPQRTERESVTLVVAGALAIAWLVQLGQLPEQMLRAALVMATAVFVLSARYTSWPVTSRALLAVLAAGATAGTLLAALGSSWAEVRWWVGRQLGLTARSLSGWAWIGGGGETGAAAGPDAWLAESVGFVSDYYPAIAALQLMAGLALATAIYHRTSPKAWGTDVGRLRDFRFADQLGWVVVVTLLVLLTPGLALLRTGASNALLVLGTLYAMRGAGVGLCALDRAGLGRGLGAAIVCVGALLMLPIALGGAILVGVVDSHMDIRRRWLTPTKPG